PAGHRPSHPRGRRFLGLVDRHIGRPSRARGETLRIPRWPGGPPTAELKVATRNTRPAISKDGDDRMRKRQFIAGVLGLALIGCAQSRSTVPKGASKSTEPIGLTPVPSVYDTINRGTGNSALVQSAIKDPADPHWNGQAPV